MLDITKTRPNKKNIIHDSATKHVSGKATYIDDILAPQNCLHIWLLTSPHAHAEILNIDKEKAEKMQGVAAILTAKDIKGVNNVAAIMGEEELLASQYVHYAGQIVAAVAAETRAEARAATKEIIVEYKELPAILDVETAREKEKFVGEPYEFTLGDAAKAMKNATHNLKGQIEIGGQDHFYLESHAALALPQEDGDMIIHSSSQHPTEVQHLVAKILGLSDHSITVDVRRMGGGFGGKESQAAFFGCLAALAADKTGCPAKICLDRDEDMIITGKRHPFKISYNVAFDDDGKLEAIETELMADCGHATDLSNAVVDRAMFHSDNAYFLNNANIKSYRCRTNHVSHTAFRGFGGPQGVLGIEVIMDDIARYLRKDPLEIRRVNFYGDKTGLETPYHQEVEDCVIEKLVDELTKKADYENRRADIISFNKNSKYTKRGIALTPVKFGISFTATHLNQGAALIHIYNDGSIQLNHGGTEMGQGLFTKVSQIVAEEFALPLEAIKITSTNTGKVPNTSPTAASSGTDINGMAAKNAAIKLKKRLADFMALEWEVDAKDIIFEEEKLKTEGHEISFKDAVNAAYFARIQLSATGFYKTPKIEWDRDNASGRPFLYYAYGAAITEVELDILTGEYKILRADIVHDAGKSINPQLDIGQIEGGYIQGLGWLTTEELFWDNKGILKTHAPSTYKIPTARDIPPIFNISLFDNQNKEDVIRRSKAVGEPPLMLVISGFLALKDALAAAIGDDLPKGDNIELNSPATPERLLMTLEKYKLEKIYKCS